MFWWSVREFKIHWRINHRYFFSYSFSFTDFVQLSMFLWDSLGGLLYFTFQLRWWPSTHSLLLYVVYEVVFLSRGGNSRLVSLVIVSNSRATSPLYNWCKFVLTTRRNAWNFTRLFSPIFASDLDSFIDLIPLVHMDLFQLWDRSTLEIFSISCRVPRAYLHFIFAFLEDYFIRNFLADLWFGWKPRRCYAK